MNGEETEESTIVTELVASSYFVNGTDVSLPRLYSRPSLPADRSDVPSKSALNEWNYLNDIKKFILSEEEKLESIGLLNGTNCPKALGQLYDNELNSLDLIRCLQSKLRMYLQDKWNRRAFDIRTIETSNL